MRKSKVGEIATTRAVERDIKTSQVFLEALGVATPLSVLGGFAVFPSRPQHDENSACLWGALLERDRPLSKTDSAAIAD